MSGEIVIAIDAMGGDHAPKSVVEGVDIAARAAPQLRFDLHGRERELKELLQSFPQAAGRSSIRHCETSVAMDAKPSQALRQSKGSSMWNAIEAVKTGQARACVSAGNTGALMAIAKLQLRMAEGVHRPAIVANWPTVKGYSVVLDVGANVEADPAQLIEFAILGEAYYRAIYGIGRPRVGLLNIGSEDLKGREEIREAARILRDMIDRKDLDMDFVGYVEGDDISQHHADVVVTEGYAGNVALKTAEGTAKLVGHWVKGALTQSPLSRLGALFLLSALKGLKARMDPNTSNGGVFLGLNGLVVKSHGGANGPGFAAAIGVAHRMALSNFEDEIRTNLSHLPALASSGAHREDATQKDI